MIFLASRLFQLLRRSFSTSDARHLAIAISLTLGGCLHTPTTPTASLLRQPVLETIMKEREIIAQDAQGTFRLLPVSPHTVRLRVWADDMLTVLLDGVALTKGHGGLLPTGSGGGFLVNSYALVGGSRKIFSEIIVKFPDSFSVDTCQATISIQYEAVSQSVQNATRVDVLLTNPLSNNCPRLPQLASRTFDDGGENSKPNGRALSQIVSRNAVLAGWLFGDVLSVNPGPSPRPGESEDFHYDIWLDDDFLA